MIARRPTHVERSGAARIASISSRVQIPDQLLLLAFDGNRQETRDEIHPLGIAERDEPKEAPDGREANVPGPDGIAPVLLQMGEKGENGAGRRAL